MSQLREHQDAQHIGTIEAANTTIAFNLETAVDRLNQWEKPVFVDVLMFLCRHPPGESATQVIARF